MNKLLSKLLGVYDTLSTPKKLHFFEVAILKVSIISFVAHIAFIYFENRFDIFDNYLFHLFKNDGPKN
jgi:hypothetical protein